MMNSIERVQCALERKQPDRVPHFEWMVDVKVREALFPGLSDPLEFYDRMDWDAVITDAWYAKEKAGEGRWLSEWGFVIQDTGEEHGVEVESPIKTREDFERYQPPDPHAPGRFTPIEEALEKYGSRRAVIVHLNDVFTLPRYLMGMQDLLKATIKDPELVRSLVELSVDINLELAQEVAARGVKIVFTGDDYAYNAGPLMSPAHFRELFYPGLKRVMGGFKDLGLYVIKHSDGNLWPILDMIIDTGIDCLDPIDPLGGMDLAEVKEKYGDRVALKGNVDCAQLMTFGTRDEVIQATRTALKKGMPGGGYILSSSNSIHSAVPPENYLALVETWREYGSYS
ncbi:MAG: uroporphyrinogen decarboxylase family protein [Anaerolineales bacterium]|jgi:uroporphyrinogen decarboxylase